jgi:hypothetical protein
MLGQLPAALVDHGEQFGLGVAVAVPVAMQLRELHGVVSGPLRMAERWPPSTRPRRKPPV